MVMTTPVCANDAADIDSTAVDSIDQESVASQENSIARVSPLRIISFGNQ
jgi:hypothetical protein